MKWTVKFVAEGRSSVEHEVITIECGESISPGTNGLTIAEGKVILEGLQKHVVASQTQGHNVAQRLCSQQCGKAFRSKGYYRSTLRSIYGNVPMRVRRVKGCPCTGSENHSYSVLVTNKYPVTPELKYLTAKMAALIPFGKAADFLSELLPVSAEVSASTVRNRTMRVGLRLQKSAEALANAVAPSPCKAAVIGFDGGYVQARHQRPERYFEIVAGKILAENRSATHFAFVRQGGGEGVRTADLALVRLGVKHDTSLTILTDGEAGLRANSSSAGAAG